MQVATNKKDIYSEFFLYVYLLSARYKSKDIFNVKIKPMLDVYMIYLIYRKNNDPKKYILLLFSTIICFAIKNPKHKTQKLLLSYKYNNNSCHNTMNTILKIQ